MDILKPLQKVNRNKVQQEGSCLPVRYEVAAHHQGQVTCQGRHGGPRRAGEQGGEDRGVGERDAEILEC